MDRHLCNARSLSMTWTLQVCYYRDKNSINKFQVAKVTTDGVDICEPFALETNWDFKVSRRRMGAHLPSFLNPHSIAF